MDKIILKGIQFYGYHGVSEAERNLDDTINYSAIFRLVVKIGTSEKFILIESLTQKIADAILSQFPIETVLVRVKKLTPPIPGELEYAGVEILRKNN